jgi:hypothetical protein
MTDAASLQRLARTAGLIYLVLIVVGMFSPIVLETLVVPGDAETTARNVRGALGLFRVSLLGWIVIVVADVAISVVFYLLFESFDRALSLVSATLRLVYSTVLGAYLLHLFEASLWVGSPELQESASAAFDTFSAGFRLALVFFGAHLIVLGLLLNGSRYVPRLIAVLIFVAGAGYIADGLASFFLLDRAAMWSTILLTPAFLGEVSLTAWLLAKGVDPRGVPR